MNSFENLDIVLCDEWINLGALSDKSWIFRKNMQLELFEIEIDVRCRDRVFSFSKSLSKLQNF